MDRFDGQKVAVLGAGSWGIAIANVLVDNGYRPFLWEFDPHAAKALLEKRELPGKLPGITIPEIITITNDLAQATADAQAVCFIVPSQTVRSVAAQLASLSLSFPVVINFAKGVEVTSLKRISEVIKQELGSGCTGNVITISGPSHAEEVARRIPTAVVAGSQSLADAEIAQTMFSNDYFRVYTNDDIVGVELGGSSKNVIAIAAGILDGLQLGDNTKGALLTRGIAEMTRLGVRMGAKPATFAGLAGIGDLITTCTSKHSRNRFVGERIGQGQTLKAVLAEMTMVAEGVTTTEAIHRLASQLNVEMPICTEVYRVLFEDKPAADAVADLMKRELKPETWAE